MFLASLLRPVQFRGKARLLHSLCSSSGLRTTKVFGYEMQTDLSKWIERSIYLGVFEPDETSLIKGVLRPGMTVVDVGANVGYYSLMAARSGARAFAFEPSPYAAGRLRETVRANALEQVEVLEAALGDEEGSAPIFISNDATKTSPSMVANDETSPKQIPVTTLDRFLGERNIDRVDLLKIDVEGFEPNVIRGAAAALAAGRVRNILCEFNQHWLSRNQSSAAALFKLISSFGFVSATEFRSDLPLQNLMFSIPS
jgi:FkbM family methyltransferase